MYEADHGIPAQARPHSIRDTEVTSFLLIALGVVVLSQVTRVLFPIMFEIGEDWDFLAAGLVALAVFAFPLAALALVMVTQRVALAAGAGLMALVLLTLRLAEPIPAWLAIVGVALALVGATVLAVRLPMARSMSTGFIPGAIIAGLALDTTVKSVFRSWDLAWQTDVISLLAVAVLGGGLGLVTLVASRQSDSSAVALGGLIPPAGWIALGAFAMLQLLFLHNVGFVSSQAGISFASAVAVVLVGDVATLLVIDRVVTHALPKSAKAVGGLIAVALAWALTTAVGIGAAFLVVALQVLAGGGIAVTIAERDSASQTGSREAIVAIAGGGVLFLALIGAWQVYLDRELPLPREAVPAIAAAVVAGLALAQRPTRQGGRTVAEVMARLGIAALAVVVPIGLWVSQPSMEPAVVADTVRIVNYNIRGSVDIDGQVRPDLIATEILTSDPDVVVLQEVGRGWSIHASTDLLAFLQWELGMDYVFESAGDEQFGNVIFSRLPMDEVASGRLPKDGTQDRSYILVTVQAGGGDLSIAATHLHSRSIPQISAFIAAVAPSPRLVIAGDMNFAPDDPEVALFVEAGFTDAVGATGEPCRTTSMEPTSGCDRPDWVFVSGGLTAEHLRIGTGGASDHLAQHVAVRIGN